MCKKVICILLVGAWLMAVPLSVMSEETVAVNAGAISAASAVLYEPSAGRVLFEKDAHTPRAMASTTKLMTALLFAEAFPPQAEIVVAAAAADTEGSTLGLKAGDCITAEDLLRGMLLESGNDAANAAALAVDGSYEAFAARMNERAAQLGMTHSGFVTPSGLDAEGHQASAYDMALLAAAVLKNDRLATICATKSTVIHFGNPPVPVGVSNHNRLLSIYPDAVGLKTGFTKKAGRCLVSAAVRDGVTLIAVTLHAPNDWDDHTALLDAGFSLLCTEQPEQPALPLLAVVGGEKAHIALQCTPLSPITRLRGDDRALTVRLELPAFVPAPVREGDTVGTVRVLLGGDTVVLLPVMAAETAEAKKLTYWQRFGLIFKGFLTELWK